MLNNPDFPTRCWVQTRNRLFQGQLAYHADIDYSEKVDYMPGHEVDDGDVRAFLIDKALDGVM